MSMILDTETIGFPLRIGYDKYYDYKLINKYDSSRIVQLSYMICDEKLDSIELKDTIIKLDNFTIKNSNIHGITDEISLSKGEAFIDAANKFYLDLQKVSHIFAHNIMFDINIIKSELYRYELHDIIKEIESKTLICSMENTKKIVNITNSYGLKSPNLAELYKNVIGTEITNQHNSKYDVINLHKIIKKLFDSDKYDWLTLDYSNLAKKRKLNYTKLSDLKIE